LIDIFRELKVPGLVLFVLGIVWVSAYARRLDQQADGVRFWPAINLNAEPARVEVTAVPVQPGDDEL
jgi:hypothetical protein